MPLPDITPLNTARLTLRSVQASDLPDLLVVNGDPQVTDFLPYATWQTLDDGQAWLQRVQVLAAAGTGQQRVLVLRATQQVVGGLLLFRFEEGSARAEVGYVLGRSHWGQGLMHEALQGLCSHAFGPLGLRRLEAEVNPANGPSNALLQRVGFTREGTLRQRWVGKGRTYDTHLYGLLSAEWQTPLTAAAPNAG